MPPPEEEEEEEDEEYIILDIGGIDVELNQGEPEVIEELENEKVDNNENVLENEVQAEVMDRGEEPEVKMSKRVKHELIYLIQIQKKKLIMEEY